MSAPSSSSPPPPPRLEEEETAERLRKAFVGAGFTEERVAEMLASPPRLHPAASAPLHDLRLARSDDRLSLLTRLFVLGKPIERSMAAQALAPATLEELRACGLIRDDVGSVTASFRIEVVEDVLLASDWFGINPAPEAVLGKNEPGLVLAHLAHQGLVRSVLDVGAGGGMQALLAAPRAERIVGVDVNARALRFADFNARLNGVTNVEWIEGSWFEPVSSRRFDIIIANPPYAISPDSDFLYRDAGLSADAASAHVVASTARHLEIGGLGYVMCNWMYSRGDDWWVPVAGWLAGSGCEAVVFRFGSYGPEAYAALWNTPLLKTGIDSYEDALARWVAHYRSLGIEEIAIGAVVARRRADGREAVEAIDLPRGVTGPCGDHVLRILDGSNQLRGLRDDELVEGRLEMVEGHRIEQTLSLRDGRYRAKPAVVRVTPGLEVRGRVDPDALEILYRCDGRKSLRGLLADVGAGHSADDDIFRATVVAARELVNLGLATWRRS